MSDKTLAMREGGKALARVRDQLQAATQAGMSFADIEAIAQDLIKKAQMLPSFDTVADYKWATCIMKNDELLHGIPSSEKNVEQGDVITIDVGILHKGFHTDTSITFAVGNVPKSVHRFLSIGQEILSEAIAQARVGARVYDISRVMQKGLHKHGYGAVYQMVGHGIGTQLHMEPNVPCVVTPESKHDILVSGQTIAIEIMYTMGEPDLAQDADGWTYRTVDGSLSAMFEHTVLVGASGPEIVTL